MTVSAATSAEQRVAELEAMAVPSVVRMRVPDRPITFDDLVRGPVTFGAEHVADFVIVRGNGEPLYTLVNPVDDALMEITHVLRGEDLLPSTPRQIVLYEALKQIGVGSGRTPIFGHLPTVLGEGNRRLSKRDKGSGLAEYQQKGYLPEALLNYLALLGWAIADDRDIFSIEEMVEAFDILRVNANPARFDAKKCEAINASHIRLLEPAELTAALVPFLVRSGLVSDPPLPDEQQLLARGDPARAGADQHPLRGGRPGRLLVHRGRCVGDRPGRGADRRRRADAGRGVRGDRGVGGLRPRIDRSRAPGGAGRRPRAQAPVWPSGRFAPRSPVGGSRRRCSSRWNCWDESPAWPGSRPPEPA